jgi:hypothetical protein
VAGSSQHGSDDTSDSIKAQNTIVFSMTFLHGDN